MLCFATCLAWFCFDWFVLVPCFAFLFHRLQLHYLYNFFRTLFLWNFWKWKMLSSLLSLILMLHLNYVLTFYYFNIYFLDWFGIWNFNVGTNFFHFSRSSIYLRRKHCLARWTPLSSLWNNSELPLIYIFLVFFWLCISAISMRFSSIFYYISVAFKNFRSLSYVYNFFTHIFVFLRLSLNVIILFHFRFYFHSLLSNDIEKDPEWIKTFRCLYDVI